jgi:shikimate kinase
MNYDYLSPKEFDLMTEEEFLIYLDKKAEMIRNNHAIMPLLQKDKLQQINEYNKKRKKIKNG